VYNNEQLKSIIWKGPFPFREYRALFIVLQKYN
jgi:hypothetical protein